jgi:SET domain
MPLLWPEVCRGEWSVPSNGPLHLNGGNASGSGSEDHRSHHIETFSVLPAKSLKLLEAQAIRYRQDFEAAVSLIPSAKDAYQQTHRRTEDSFKYAWCIVNTRCLYFDPPSSSAPPGQQHTNPPPIAEKNPPTPNQSHDTNEFMVLCPLIDLFNHTSSSTSAFQVTHTTSGFTVTSLQPSTGARNEELFVSYGPHSNDFLLVEYGFLLPGETNMHDSVNLDSVILPTLSTEQKSRLDAKGYLGAYTLFSRAANGGEAGVCWRTEVVARIGRLSVGQWEEFVGGVLDDDGFEEDVEAMAKAAIEGWVAGIRVQAERSARALQRIGEDQKEISRLFRDSEQANTTATSTGEGNADLKILESGTQIARRRYDLVLQRWRQILQICQSFLS